MSAVLDAPVLLNCQPGSPELRLICDPADAPAREARATQLADPTGVICAVAHAALEALRGARSVHQLVGLLSPDVFQSLSAQVRAQTTLDIAHGVRRSARARLASSGSTGATASGAPVRRVPTRIIRARVTRVSAVAAEASVILQDGDRVRAAALRAEEFRGKWRICVLQIG